MANAFKLTNLTKTFSEFQLGPLNLELEPGTVLGYIGPNGSGKTTTMHCMVGLVRSAAARSRFSGGQTISPNRPYSAG